MKKKSFIVDNDSPTKEKEIRVERESPVSSNPTQLTTFRMPFKRFGSLTSPSKEKKEEHGPFDNTQLVSTQTQPQSQPQNTQMLDETQEKSNTFEESQDDLESLFN